MSKKQTCPRCGSPLERNNTIEEICPQCAFNAILETEETAAYTTHRNEADAAIKNLKGLDNIEYLNKGGMGILYHARQQQLNRDIAVKVISSHFLDDPEFMGRFEREIKTLGSLNHPNIVTIHESGFQDDVPYFIMEYVEGQSLRETMNEGQMSKQDILQIIKSIAEALAYAHDQGITHRDIKPENILIRHDGTVKVVDFGIAQILQDGNWSTQLTSSQKIMGSPKYMAPEQIETPNQTDHRVDIFALGTLMYELITGQIPQGTFPPPSDLSEFDERMDHIVIKALQSNPKQRHNDMHEFIQEFKTILEPEHKTQTNVLAPIPFKERIQHLSASRVFWAMLAGAFFQLIFLMMNASSDFKANPNSIFEEYVEHINHYSKEKKIRKRLTEEYTRHEIKNLLSTIAQSKDHRKAAASIQCAISMNRLDDIPIASVVDILTQWTSEYNFEADFFGINPDKHLDRQRLLSYVIAKHGPAIEDYIYRNIIQGGIPKDNLLGAASGLSQIASPALLKSMQTYLIEQPNSKYFTSILYAWTGRLCLPQPIKLELDQNLKEVYLKYIPNLLDHETSEAHWYQAQNLAREIDAIVNAYDKIESATFNKQTNIAYWASRMIAGSLKNNLSEDKSAERLAKDLNTSWPLAPSVIETYKRDLLTNEKTKHPYKKAILLYWLDKSSFNIPHFARNKSRFRNRQYFDNYFDYDWNSAPKEKDPTKSVSWEVQTFFISTIAGNPFSLGTKQGKGPLNLQIEKNIPLSKEMLNTHTQWHFGISHITQSRFNYNLGKFTLNSNSPFKKNETFYKLDGNISATYRGSRKEGHIEGLFYPGEAGVLYSNLIGSQAGSLRHGQFSILTVNPETNLKPENRWRVAIAQSLKRISQNPFDHLESVHRVQLLSLSAWTPVPEAKESLLRLWERSKNEKVGGRSILRVKARTLCGAALLILGDSTPLNEQSFLKDLPDDLALRIYLFTKNEVIRKEVEPFIAMPKTYYDAIATRKILNKRNERDSRLANWVNSQKKSDFEEYQSHHPIEISYIIVLIIILLLVYVKLVWLPIPNNHFSWACLLIIHGVVFRFVTYESNGILWFPLLSSVFFVIASFLYGKVFLKGLCTLLLIVGIIEMMMPHSTAVIALSTILFCSTIAFISLDFLSRLYTKRINFSESISFLCIWWVLIIPIGFVYSLKFFISIFYPGASLSLLSMPLELYYYLLVGLSISLLVLMRSSAQRLGHMAK